MADRRDVARLAAEDVEHADAIFARGDLRERADADEVLEVADALLVHVGSPVDAFSRFGVGAVDAELRGDLLAAAAPSSRRRPCLRVAGSPRSCRESKPNNR